MVNAPMPSLVALVKLVLKASFIPPKHALWVMTCWLDRHMLRDQWLNQWPWVSWFDYVLYGELSRGGGVGSSNLLWMHQWTSISYTGGADFLDFLLNWFGVDFFFNCFFFQVLFWLLWAILNWVWASVQDFKGQLKFDQATNSRTPLNSTIKN